MPTDHEARAEEIAREEACPLCGFAHVSGCEAGAMFDQSEPYVCPHYAKHLKGKTDD